MKLKIVVHALVLFSMLHPSTTFALWQPGGVAVSIPGEHQQNPAIIPDGTGGAIVTWMDYRSGTNYDIYGQRISASGVPQWPVNGVALCTATNHQRFPTIASDGAGGAIVTWMDERAATQDIYAQRIDASGAVRWTTDGVALCTAAYQQQNPMVVSDGAGGAIVTWHDFRNGTDYDVYAQRVDGSGVTRWAADGVVLSAEADFQTNPMIASDGAGGAIVTWNDDRSLIEFDIYAQRVNASGVPLWASNGVALCADVTRQVNPTIVSDGAGGAIVTWWDLRVSDYDIYAQRVNALGVMQWTGNGVALCTAASHQFLPQIASDGAGGAIVAWYDIRNGTDYDVYARRIDALGVPQWTADGVALSAAANHQYNPTIISDGAGGAIVTWQDNRGTDFDIYTQRVNASGVVQWTPDGVALAAASNNQERPTIAADGAGGAVVSWQDLRNGTYDIYAHRISSSGQLGPTTAVDEPAALPFRLGYASPNPSTGMVRWSLALSAAGRVHVELFDAAGRSVRTLLHDTLPAGAKTLAWDGLDASGHRVASGVYYARATVGGATGVANIQRIR